MDKRDAAGYDYHLPVLFDKVLEYLITDAEGIYIDGTLGGGGHAAGIISRLHNSGKLIAFDKDEEAIEYCDARFRGENGIKDPRVILINDSYDRACSITEGAEINGIFLDLGLSSRQLDKAERGFSFKLDAPIDMRFGRKGESAELLINTSTQHELEIILRKYGEEPFAYKISQNIVLNRTNNPIRTTKELASIIEMTVPGHLLNKSLARVFQAFRIAVNRELEILETTLINIVPKLRKGGRIVILTYHSLEDKIVKNFFREMSKPSEKDEITGAITKSAELKILTKKAIIADESELNINPRSRSAKLRVAEKL